MSLLSIVAPFVIGIGAITWLTYMFAPGWLQPIIMFATSMFVGVSTAALAGTVVVMALF